MRRSLPRISEINEELDHLLDEEFEQVLRVIPSSFGEGFEWYEHGLAIVHSDNMAKIERFLSNEEAVIEAIGVQWQLMKYIKLKKPSMLSKEFCLMACKVNSRDQDKVVKLMSAEFWDDMLFCLNMMTESPTCLPYTPLPTRHILRRLWRQIENQNFTNRRQAQLRVTHSAGHKLRAWWSGWRKRCLARCWWVCRARGATRQREKET